MKENEGEMVGVLPINQYLAFKNNHKIINTNKIYSNMKTTFELIEQYLLSTVDLTKVELINYFVNGSIIKIQYSYESLWINERLYDNYIEVELLDYITFLFNLKK